MALSKRALGFAAILLLSACGLQHWEQRRYCANADGNDAACRARPDWCIATGGTSCQGEGCPGRYCWPRSGACLGILGRDARCPSDERFLHGDRVADLSRYEAWKRKHVSERVWDLSGRRITRAVFDSLSESDRDELCGTTPLNPCRLEWDAGTNAPACRLRADACRACAVKQEPYRCYAKNLCTGVVCL